jgi:oligopeptidase B
MIQPPVADKRPTQFNEHGVTRVDNYYWLRERENEDVLNYLRAENAYLESALADVKPLREALFEEIKGRIKQTDMSVPYVRKGFKYYSRYEEGREYPIYCREMVGSDVEQIMLDVNELAAPYAYYSVGTQSVSRNNKLLAFAEDTLSRRIYTLRFKNLETAEFLPDVVRETTGNCVWAADNETVFYSVQDPVTLRSHKIYRHKLGTLPEEDELVYEEQDETFTCYVYLAKSGDYVFIESSSTTTTETRFLEAANPTGAFRVVQPRTRGLEYSVSQYGDQFYIVHNHQAQNFKLSKAPIARPQLAHWSDVVPHRPDVLLEGIEIFKDHLVVTERSEGLTKLRVMPWSNNTESHYVAFNDPAYGVYLSANVEFDTPVLRYVYTSLTTPNTVYDYDMNTRQATLLKQQEVLGDFNSANYTSERFFVTSRDGARVPVSLVYRNGFERNGSAPLLLYGYGSYGASMDPYFSSARLSLLDRGFLFAIAHIRGGEEMGRPWYEDGKMLKKMNTFNDFIDCGEFLVKEGYAHPKHLYAMGGSAGGLLMGAVVNMRPQLWNGIVAQVPFVDVVTTMLDASIPLTTGEYDEWGNPNDPEYFHYMLSYSPYDNVEAKDYPHMLVTTGLHDSQVQYWEPAKWVAKLRELKTDNNLLLLYTDMDTGHGGASGRFEALKEVALEYAFLLKLAGRTTLKPSV